MFKHIKIALEVYGTFEVPGKVHNPSVLKFFHETGHKYINDDETPWCAAFVNWCLMKANIKGTGKLNARSFLNLGVKVKVPRLGDIVVLWRISSNSSSGHVGFFISQLKDKMYILSGNQNNRVCIQSYPVSQLLSYQRLI